MYEADCDLWPGSCSCCGPACCSLGWNHRRPSGGKETSPQYSPGYPDYGFQKALGEREDNWGGGGGEKKTHQEKQGEKEKERKSVESDKVNHKLNFPTFGPQKACKADNHRDSHWMWEAQFQAVTIIRRVKKLNAVEMKMKTVSETLCCTAVGGEMNPLRKRGRFFIKWGVKQKHPIKYPIILLIKSSIHPSIAPSIYLSIYLSIHPSIKVFIHTSICTSIHQPIHQSNSLTHCESI